MPTPGRCSECGASLRGKIASAKTCGKTACRSARSRRIARARKKGGESRALPEHQAALRDAIHGQVKDVAHDVLKEELRPVAREALTEDVLRALDQLIRLTPQAVANLAMDLASGDERVRQKATELLLRYTLGNQSIAPTAQNAPAPMQVELMWPTAAPAAGPAPELDVPTVEAVELADEPAPQPQMAADDDARECMECHETKPLAEFVGTSERCQVCHDDVLAKVRERFGEDSV